MIKALDGKSKKIADEINQAKLLRQKAEELLAQAKKHHEETIEHSKYLVEESKDLAKKLLDDSRKMVSEEVNKKLSLAKDRIKQEEVNVIREIKSSIIFSAIKTIEEKAHKLSDNSSSTIAKKAIEDIGKTVH